MAERIQKVLASAGLGSRRKIEALIKAERIIVDGRPAELGERLEGMEKVLIDGHEVSFGQTRHARQQYFLAYYKPAGEVTSRADPGNRSTVFDDIRPPPHGRWISVGRLDINTSGLLLLTTDGELAHRLMHPRYEIVREYAVRVLGQLTRDQRRRLLEGVELDDGPAAVLDIHADGGSGANSWYRVTIREGRNREIRRLFEAIGLAVGRLIRVTYGPVRLSNLRRGETRRLTVAEIAALYEAVGMTPARPMR